jgi:hypothetical protein
VRSPGFLGLIYDRYWPCNICGDHIGVLWRLGFFILIFGFGLDSLLYVLTDNGSY